MLTVQTTPAQRADVASDTMVTSVLLVPVVLMLVVYSGALSWLLDGRPRVVESALLPALSLVGVLVAILAGTAVVRVSLIVLWLVVWQLMALAWAFDVPSSFFLARTEVMSVFMCSLIVGSFDSAQLRKLFTVTASIMIVVTLLAVVTVPEARSVAERDRAVGLEVNTWRGFFPHKNSMGVWTAIYAVSALALMKGRARIAMVTAGTVLVLGSRSVTALLTFGIGVVIWAWARSMFRRSANISIAIGFGVAVATLAGVTVLQNLSTLVGWFGKDPTLTGRTTIWREVWSSIGERPFTGYGPAGFWYSEGEFRAALDRRIGFGVFQAHQGVLEALLLYGIPGVIIIGVVLFAVTRLGIQFGARGQGELGAFVVAVMSMIALASLSEPMFTGGGLDLLLVLLAGLASAQRWVSDSPSTATPALRE